jgi:hypothetical protein
MCYNQHTSPQNCYKQQKVSNVQRNRLSVQPDSSSPVLNYWHQELLTKGDGTKQRYEEFFQKFLEFIDKNPDELINTAQKQIVQPKTTESSQIMITQVVEKQQYEKEEKLLSYELLIQKTYLKQ